MSKWIEKTLGEVTSYLAKGIPPKYVEELSEDAIYVLNQKCNRNFVISYEPARMHDLSKKKVGEEKMLRPGDVLINSTGEGTAGRIAQIWDIPHPTTTDGHMITIRPTIEIDPLFYGYAVKAYLKQIETLAEGSTGQTELNKTRLQNEIIIRFPENKEEQYNIAVFLENIDKKITVNEEINRNLIEQAQAYYSELFIENASENWQEGTLSDVGTVVAGGTPSKAKEEYYTEHGIAWITPKDLSLDKSVFISHGKNDISELGYEKSSATKMPEGTVLFSSRAPIGYIAIATNEVTTNQGFKSVVPKENVGTAYIYFLLRQLLPTIENMASGSTFKEISGSSMKIVPTMVPDNETLSKFDEFCQPLMKQVQKLEQESKKLVILRDSLLPKLMSGEVDVSDLEI